MNSFFIGPMCAMLLVGVREYARTLVQEHLSGTSKNYFIECTLAGFFGYGMGMALVSSHPIGFTIFFTLLGVTLFTDAWVMLISRYVTLNAIPIALCLSTMQLLPLTFSESLFGAFFGYFLLSFIARASRSYFDQEALGQGDIDLLSMIGAFTGWQGCWFALFIGSMVGSLFGLIMVLKKGTTNLRNQQLPLGVFLVMGVILYTVHAQNIYKMLLLS